MRNFIFLIAGTLALCVGFFYWAQSNKIRFNYPSSALYSHFGLDISHHQGEIDWNLLDTNKYSFIYIKATEGGDFVDKKFERNFNEAIEKRMLVGGYHFWSFCRSKEDQLANIIENIPPLPGSLAPALDIESLKECDGIKIEDRLVDDINYANEKISELYGVKPIIYTTKEFSARYPEVLNFDNPFWLRSLVGSPTTFYDKEWLIWQYYNAGSVKGIKGPADLNVLKGGLKNLEKLLVY